MKALPLAGFLLLAAATTGLAIDLSKRSVSASRQFIIYANDANTRSEAARIAEDLKADFLSLQRTKDAWKLPTILMLEAPAPATRRPPRSLLKIYEGDDNQNKVQLDVFDTRLVAESDFRIRMIEAIATEQAYRNAPIKSGRAFSRPPAWFVEGFAEKLRTRDDSSGAALYAGLLTQGQVPKLADFLEIDPARLDPTSLAIYRAQAAALLDAVLSLPNGRNDLRAYLSSPRRYPGSVKELSAGLTDLSGDPRLLGRRWLLAIARASAADRVDLLTERETARQLEAILNVRALPDPKRPELVAMSGPHALPYIARSQSGPFILSQTESSLLQLSLRAHPLYKSLVNEYLAITRELLARPKRRVDKRIATAEGIRAGLTRQTNESRDYLDWVEATKIKTQSEDLEQALDGIDQLESSPQRNDAISRYLDSVSERRE